MSKSIWHIVLCERVGPGIAAPSRTQAVGHIKLIHMGLVQPGLVHLDIVHPKLVYYEPSDPEESSSG